MPRQPFLPRGAGGNRRSFESFIRQFAKHVETTYIEAYTREVEIIIKDLIDTTPI